MQVQFQPPRIPARAFRTITAAGVVAQVADAYYVRRPRSSGSKIGDRGRRCTDVLLGLNAGSYALQMISRGAFLSWGAKVNSLINAGQWWRLLTPALLHGNLVHLAVNCFSLNNIGPSTERLLGPQRMTAVYCASALSGSLFSYWFNPHPAVGASGAIFGLLGCLTAVHLKYEKQMGVAGQHRLRSLANMAGINLLLGLFSRSVDNWAHVGGFLGGAALSLAIV